MDWFIRKFKGRIRCLKENGIRYTALLFFKKIIKKVLGIINKIFKGISRQLALGFVEIIKVKTYVKDDRYGHVYFVFLFGKQIYPTKRQHRTNAWVDPNQPIIYFKINRMSDYAKPCVQHWVNIAYHMKADYYFICDNKFLEYHLLHTVNFPGADIKFISSMRKPLKKICEALCVPHWRNATYAHLTPFYHAKELGAKRFWAIDADDMMICLRHTRAAELLNAVEKMANKEEISIISVDIWRSRTLGRHWSWGIAYVNDNVDFCDIFAANPDLSWTIPYQETDVNFNLDWFMTYLKDSKKARIESFYVENMYLIHWLNFLRSPLSGSVYFWKDGKIIFPIMRYVFCYERLGIIDIADCIKVDFEVSLEEGLYFFENEVSTLRWSNNKTRGLNNVQDFSSRKNTIENL